MHPVNKTLFPSPLISVLLLCKVAGSHIPKYPVTELDTLRWDKANCKPAPATYGRPTPGAQLWVEREKSRGPLPVEEANGKAATAERPEWASGIFCQAEETDIGWPDEESGFAHI